MNNKNQLKKTFVFIALCFFIFATQPPTNAAPLASYGIETPIWRTDLTSYSKVCGNCDFSSPALADMNNDGFLDIIVGTTKGYVVVLRHNGSILWATDVSPFFGMAPNTHEIRSSPAIADIDNDGFPEIVVGAGNLNPCGPIYHGGMIVLEHNGTVKTGWPQTTTDDDGDGCKESIASTPALANLDDDPELEIVASGFDKRIYAWNHDGTLLPGFPPDSFHAQRFDWPNLRDQLADTVWSSPAIADLDRDGKNEILTGTDEGMFDIGWAGGEFMREWVDWNCHYALPPGWPNDPGKYCGGALYGLNADGTLLPNFPRYYYEAIFSSPVVVDTNGDGILEIFMGQGDFYYNNSTDHPTDGFRLYGLDIHGEDLPGWEGGKFLDGSANAIPAIGDITGDGSLEIIISTMNRSVYAFHSNGTLVSGFPMTPHLEWGQISAPIATSAVTGDYDGDGKDEIFVNTSWTTTVIDGNGAQLTGDDLPNNILPIFYSEGPLLNSPAIGDIDNDGQLELITQNSLISVFNLPDASDMATWPLAKLNAARTSTMELAAFLDMGSDNVVIMHQSDDEGNIVGSLTVMNQGTMDVSWSATHSDGMSINPTSGTLYGFDSTLINFIIPREGLEDGTHTFSVTVSASFEDGISIPGSPVTIPITVHIGDFEFIYLPILQR